MVLWAHAGLPPPNGIRIGSVISAVLTAHSCDWHTDRGTDHATPSVAIARILHSARQCGLVVHNDNPYPKPLPAATTNNYNNITLTCSFINTFWNNYNLQHIITLKEHRSIQRTRNWIRLSTYVHHNSTFKVMAYHRHITQCQKTVSFVPVNLFLLCKPGCERILVRFIFINLA